MTTVQLTRTLRTRPAGAPGTPLGISVGGATVAFAGLASVAAFFWQAEECNYWGIYISFGEAGWQDFWRAGMVTCWLFLLVCCVPWTIVKLGYVATWLWDWLFFYERPGAHARYKRYRAEHAANLTRSLRSMSPEARLAYGATGYVFLAMIEIAFASGLQRFGQERRDTFWVVQEEAAGSPPYVVVRTHGGKAYSKVYDVAHDVITNELRVFALDEKFHACHVKLGRFKSFDDRTLANPAFSRNGLAPADSSRAVGSCQQRLGLSLLPD